jgi:hypothetical protein
MENAMFFNILIPIGKARNVYSLQRSFEIIKKTRVKNGYVC